MIKYDPPLEAMFMGMNDGRKLPVYPMWLYREGADPIMVENTDQEDAARQEGYDSITAAAMANRHLINWFWDLEDMSPKQLRVFAKDEYDVELPEEASQGVLFKCVVELARHAPQNQSRLILMAHTVQMNYDATIEEIKRMMKPGAMGVASEVETFEVMI
jgi:hypothetical protein